METSLEDKKIIAIIPARGGSKRLPGKNVKDFAGLPLIYYTIKFAQLQKCISNVVVSTDDEQIKKIALQLGAIVIERPEHLSGDHATTASAIKYTLLELAKQNLYFDFVVTLQVTNPLRPEHLFTEALSLFEQNENIDSIISVTQSFLKFGYIDADRFIPANYSPGQRSQDLKPQFFENGLIYITKTAIVIEQEDLFGKNICPYITDEKFPVIDIDEQKDFDWGEFIFNRNTDKFSYLL